jgi:hypothetical protein
MLVYAVSQILGSYPPGTELGLLTAIGTALASLATRMNLCAPREVSVESGLAASFVDVGRLAIDVDAASCED